MRGREGNRLGGRGLELIVGRLKDHGIANYQFRIKEEPSYYVKLLTSKGERTLWGKDLHRALTEGETRPQAGDVVGARRVTREAVTVTRRLRDPQGRVVAQEERQAHRTRWVIEKINFFAKRAQMARRLRDEQADMRESVRAHPELKSTFFSVRAAQEYAKKTIADPEDRKRFLELIRGALSTSIQKGEPLPSTSLRTRSAETPETAKPRNKREDPTR
jgi:hypothetical protein